MVEEVDDLLHGPLLHALEHELKLNDPKEAVVLQEEGKLELLNLGVPHLEGRQVLSVEPLLVEGQRREVLLSAPLGRYFPVLLLHPVLVLLAEHLLLGDVVVLALPVFFALFELSLVVGSRRL